MAAEYSKRVTGKEKAKALHTLRNLLDQHHQAEEAAHDKSTAVQVLCCL